MTSTTRQSLRHRTRLPRLPANLEQEPLQNGNMLLPRLSPRPPTPCPHSSPRPPSPLRPAHALLRAPIRSSAPAPAPAPNPGQPHRSSRRRLHPLLPPQQVTPRGGTLRLTATWDSPAKSPPRPPPSSKLPRPRDCQLCTIQPMTASLTEARKGQVMPPGNLR